MMIGVLLAMLAQTAQITAGPPVPDAELGSARGGFELPNGVDVAITVQTQTVVDGAIVLKTVFRADNGPPTLVTYAPKPGTTVAAPATTSLSADKWSTMPTVTYDRQNGIQVSPGVAGPAVSIGQTTASAGDSIADGLAVVDPAAGAVTDAGKISRTDHGGVSTVRLEAPDLSITHLAGDAFGSAIANSGSDRQIDTSTVVSINLSNATPDLVGSSMLRVQDTALDALGRRL